MNNMELLKTAAVVCGILCLIAVLVCAGKTGKFFKCLFWSAGLGVVSLLLVSALSLTGIETLPLNAYTVGCSALCGIPGTLLMLLTSSVWLL